MGPEGILLRPAPETVTLVVTLLAHGCPVQAIVAAFGLDARTVAAWLDRAGVHCHAVHEPLVETPRRLGQVQADALRGTLQGAIVWMAMAVMGPTRVWLGGEVSPHRDLALIRRLMPRVRLCALVGRLLICPEGVCASVRATREACRDPVASGRRGHQPLRVWGRLLIAQVVKRSENRRVVAGERRVVHGRADQAEQARQAASGTIYNFCTPHASLREMAGKAVRGRIPAMAAGITRRGWRVGELLS